MLSSWATIEMRGSLEQLIQRTEISARTIGGTTFSTMLTDLYALSCNALSRSGTAAVLETGRALAVLRDQGWRPRRTIVWCSWDAEGIL